MKKKVFSAAMVTLLLGGSIGFAAASSPLIGAKVQGVFTIQKADGTKLGTQLLSTDQHTRRFVLFQRHLARN